MGNGSYDYNCDGSTTGSSEMTFSNGVLGAGGNGYGMSPWDALNNGGAGGCGSGQNAVAWACGTKVDLDTGRTDDEYWLAGDYITAENNCQALAPDPTIANYMDYVYVACR